MLGSWIDAEHAFDDKVQYAGDPGGRGDGYFHGIEPRLIQAHSSFDFGEQAFLLVKEILPDLGNVRHSVAVNGAARFDAGFGRRLGSGASVEKVFEVPADGDLQ